MRRLVLPLILLLATTGCCGMRQRGFCDCAEEFVGQPICGKGGLPGLHGLLHGWSHAEPAAPLPPPHPKYHPLPTRPVFAPVGTH